MLRRGDYPRPVCLGGLHSAGHHDARGGRFCRLPPHPGPDRCAHSVPDRPGGEGDILTGLGLGGDDYLLKPFRVSELRARVAAHLRRASRVPGPAARRVVRGGVAFDLAARTAAVGECPLRLTRSEYAICEYLALHPGRTFSREQIYEAVFGYDGTADASAVTEHVKNIRAKLRALGLDPGPLVTVWGVGYRWSGE